MMIKHYAVIFLLILCVFTGYAYSAELKKGAQDYSTLVQQLKGGKPVDFAALRYSYTKTPHYNPYGGDDSNKKAMFEALNNKDFAKAITHAQAVLEKNYVDLDAHFICRIAYREMKNAERQNYHTAVVKGLLDSIANSGNGQTPETAFVVITTDEEYFFLRIYGYEVMKSSLIKANDHNYDKMDVVERKTGEKTVFYFNVDIPFTWLGSQMKKQEK